MGDRGLAAGDDRLVRRRKGVPLLPFAAQREVRAKQVRLVEIEADAAIERRLAPVRAGGARAAEEIHMVVFGVDARLFFGAVADAEVDALVLALRDRDARRHFGRLQLLVERLDVGELEQLHAVQPPLGVLHQAAPVEIARLEGQLRGESRRRRRSCCPKSRPARSSASLPGFGRERQASRPSRSSPVSSCVVTFAYGIAVIAQLVERQFVRRDDQLAIARLTDFERHALLHLGEVVRRDDVEADEVDRGDRDRLALRQSSR